MMDSKIKKRSSTILLILICGFVYFTAYFTRKSLAITLANIVETTALTKEQLGLALTGLFIVYGVAQLFSGMIADRVNPKFLIFMALGVSSLMNIGLFFTVNPYVIVALWSINGLAQAFVWPPIVRFAAYNFNNRDYDKGINVITSSGYLGQCFLCLASALFCHFLGYKSLFLFAGILGLLVAILWILYTIRIPYEKPVRNVEKKEEPIKDKPKTHLFFNFVMIFILLSIITQGILRDGIESWTPTFITASFALDSTQAIMFSLILPLSAFGFIQLASFIYKRKLHNPILLAIIVYGICALLLVFLKRFSSSNAWIVLVLIALVYGSIASTNVILISFLPIYFKDTGRISTVAGVLNAIIYAGSAISGYGFAKLITNYGWDFGITMWLVVGAIGLLSIAVVYRKWNERYQWKIKNNEEIDKV